MRNSQDSCCLQPNSPATTSNPTTNIQLHLDFFISISSTTPQFNIQRRRMLKKARLLTRPTPATISPSHPESARTVSSPMDAPFRGQGRNTLSLYLLRGDWNDPNCAHRTIYMIPPSLLVISLGMGAD